MRLENSFEVSAAPEAAWELLMDVPRVIPCMPGAELIEAVDETHWKARMRVKLGPISLSFLADVARQEVDEAGRRVVLAASAREERGRGAARATIESALAAERGRTQVTTTTDLSLSGMAAQFGRGLVQEISTQLLDEFAYCLEKQLQAEAPPEPDSAPPGHVSGLRLGAAALRSAVGRHRRLTAGLWASFFFAYLWLGMVAVDVSGVLAFVLAALLGVGIYLFVLTASRHA